MERSVGKMIAAFSISYEAQYTPMRPTPVAPTAEFFEFALPRAGFSRFGFASTPLDPKALEGACSGAPTQLDGEELLIVAHK